MGELKKLLCHPLLRHHHPRLAKLITRSHLRTRPMQRSEKLTTDGVVITFPLEQKSMRLTSEQLVESCDRAGLMRQKVPEQLVVHDGPLPRNATMKILKYELKDALAEVPWP